MEEIMTNQEQESENTRVWQPNVNALPAIVRANMNLSMTPSQRRHRQHIVERAIADMVRHGETDETTVIINYEEVDKSRNVVTLEHTVTFYKIRV